jgi:hypothetical protein
MPPSFSFLLGKSRGHVMFCAHRHGSPFAESLHSFAFFARFYGEESLGILSKMVLLHFIFFYWLELVHAGWWDEVLIAFLLPSTLYSRGKYYFLTSANVIGQKSHHQSH